MFNNKINFQDFENLVDILVLIAYNKNIISCISIFLICI